MWRQQQIQNTLFGVLFRLVGDIVELLFPHHLNGNFNQVTNHRFNVAPDIPHFGKFGGSFFRNGEFDSLERRRAISVLPTPVAPIMMMFFGMISSAISGGSF